MNLLHTLKDLGHTMDHTVLNTAEKINHATGLDTMKLITIEAAKAANRSMPWGQANQNAFNADERDDLLHGSRLSAFLRSVPVVRPERNQLGVSNTTLPQGSPYNPGYNSLQDTHPVPYYAAPQPTQFTPIQDTQSINPQPRRNAYIWNNY